MTFVPSSTDRLNGDVVASRFIEMLMIHCRARCGKVFQLENLDTQFCAFPDSADALIDVLAMRARIAGCRAESSGRENWPWSPRHGAYNPPSLNSPAFNSSFISLPAIAAGSIAPLRPALPRRFGSQSLPCFNFKSGRRSVRQRSSFRFDGCWLLERSSERR